MKKNFFKKKLASALALALVVASFSPAGISAQAATATKIVKQGGGTAPTVLYVGGSKVDYSLSTIKSGVKYAWKSSNTKIATITASTGVVTAKAPGSVTITATATDKKTGKTLNTFKKTLTVNLRATSVEAGDDFTLAPGETKKLTAVKTPSNSTDVINFVSSNKEVVTVGLTGGVVTAKGAGEAVITVYSKATKASSNKSAKTVVDTVKVKVDLGVTAVKQTKANTLEVTFNGKVESAKASDFAIKRDATNESIYVKDVAINNNVVTLTTFVGMTDGKDYTLTYGEKSHSFKATDGVVADLSFAPTSIVYGTGTAIAVSTLDANGIVLNTYNLSNAPASVVDFSITTNQGYTVGDKLVLFAEGNTATAKATYHTKKYDESGKEIGAITKEATIYAVSASAITITDTKYTIAADNSTPDYTTPVTSLALNDTGKTFYFYAKDSAGNELAGNYYTIESSDSNKLLVTKISGKLAAKVVAVSEGSAYVLVKKDGVVVYSLPVTIVPARKASTITLGTYSFNISNSVTLDAKKDVSVKLVDQYSAELAAPAATAITVKSLSVPSGVTNDVTTALYVTKDTGKVTFNGKAFTTVGTYVYSITVSDLTRTVTVVVAAPTADAALYALELDTQSIDAVYEGSNKAVTARLVAYQGGVASYYVTGYTIEVTKDGSAYNDVVSLTSGSSIKIATLNGSYVSKAAVGSYVVKVTAPVGAAGADLTFTNGFVVTDSQASVTAVVSNYTPNTSDLRTGVLNAFDFYYQGSKVDVSKLQILSESDITKTTIDSKSIHVASAVVYVNIDGKYVPFTVTLGKTITLK